MRIRFEFPGNGELSLPSLSWPDSAPLPVVGLTVDVDVARSRSGQTRETFDTFVVTEYRWHLIVDGSGAVDVTHVFALREQDGVG